MHQCYIKTKKKELVNRKSNFVFSYHECPRESSITSKESSIQNYKQFEVNICQSPHLQCRHRNHHIHLQQLIHQNHLDPGDTEGKGELYGGSETDSMRFGKGCIPHHS